MNQPTIGFIGSGNMAQAIMGGLLKSDIPASNILGSARTEATLNKLKSTFGIQTTLNNIEVVQQSDVVFFAVKPDQLLAVCDEISEAVADKQPLLISVAAGVTEASLAKHLPTGVKIVRCMPNTPAMLQVGASGLFANKAVNNDDKQLAERLLQAVGITVWVDDEALIHAVTAVSGSGPAYFFRFIEAMATAGREQGLDESTSMQLTIQTALGAAIMASRSDKTPTELREGVTSKGGTTAAALKVFNENGLEKMVSDAMLACSERSQELAKEMER
ncbi:MAG: pyrroline-5-carboxylate reductase [Cellvibrionales bacterium]|nr:pyrroline-5-carboxylate reductase [Cellvibrionales bacterium]